MRYTLWNGFSVIPGNIPLERPGAYRLCYLNDGRNYIGITKNVSKRGYEHSTHAGNVRYLDKFIKDNSLGKRLADRHNHFLFEPLYYTISPLETRKGGKLHFVEQSLITLYDSINLGWNLPHPDVAKLCKTPEAISKRIDTEASLITKEKRRIAGLLRASNPNDPMHTVLRTYTPERAAKIAATKKDTIWITNGIASTTIPKGDEIPQGWRRGLTRR